VALAARRNCRWMTVWGVKDDLFVPMGGIALVTTKAINVRFTVELQ
jgi:hypothetical protein